MYRCAARCGRLQTGRVVRKQAILRIRLFYRQWEAIRLFGLENITIRSSAWKDYFPLVNHPSPICCRYVASSFQLHMSLQTLISLVSGHSSNL